MRLTGLVAMCWVCFTALGQNVASDIDFDVLVPPGGVLMDGSPANLPVQPGDLLLSLIYSPTSMYTGLMDEEMALPWAALTPFRGFYMKPWKPGEFVWYNYTLRKWTVVDTEFTPLDTLTQSFSDDDDYHDVHLFDDGTYLVVMLQRLEMDLTDIGGLPDAEILNPYMVHLDEDENILQEWSGLEHLPLNPNWDNLLWPTVDYLHWNAVQFDAHGGLLLSFRNRSQIVRLRPDDWSVHWKLGGPDSDFEMVDPGWNGFAVQHDVHDLGDGRILLFDNAIYNENGFLSRALELELDTVNFTAENVWQFAHPDGVYGAAQGSAIRLDNGNTLIGWGTAGTPAFGTRVTEVTPEGEIAYEVRFTDGANLYRARKYPEDDLQGCRQVAAVNYSDSPWLLASGTCYFDVDEDGDGWTDTEGDCDDSDPSINPGAPEIANDGIDQNCDGLDATGGCTDSTAVNFVEGADGDDGTCQYPVVLRVDMALEAMEDLNWDLMNSSLELTLPVDTAFELASSFSPTNSAWDVAQFSIELGQGEVAYRFVSPMGEPESLVRTLELTVGIGGVDEPAICFNETTPCPGCLDPMDLAYNPWAADGGECAGWIVQGCVYEEATNFSGLANLDDGSCTFDCSSACPGDLDEDGSVAISDLLEMLTVFGAQCY